MQHQAPSPGPLSALSHHSFELHEHLCFISIYLVQLLAGCVQRYQKSLSELIKVLHLKLNVIKDIRYHLVGFILDWGIWKFFS